MRYVGGHKNRGKTKHLRKMGDLIDPSKCVTLVQDRPVKVRKCFHDKTVYNEIDSRMIIIELKSIERSENNWKRIVSGFVRALYLHGTLPTIKTFNRRLNEKFPGSELFERSETVEKLRNGIDEREGVRENGGRVFGNEGTIRAIDQWKCVIVSAAGRRGGWRGHGLHDGWGYHLAA